MHQNKEYIEDFWREPKITDLPTDITVAGPSARFYSEDKFIIGELVGYNVSCLYKWILEVGPDRTTVYKKDIQVYDDTHPDKLLEEQLLRACNVYDRAANIIISKLKSHYVSDSDKAESASIILTALAANGIVLESVD